MSHILPTSSTSLPTSSVTISAAPKVAAPSATISAPPTTNTSSASEPSTGVAGRKGEINKRVLYVGGLDPRVLEDMLRDIFEVAGHVQSVKIIPDRNHKGYNYGFVEYDDPNAAQTAMQTLNGRTIHQSEIKINWAYQSHNAGQKEDTSQHFHIFVGDLSNEVDDELLAKAFSVFPTMSEARVMWDLKTGRSRGYGFVSFRERSDAEKAKTTMDGEWLGSRTIRCNWANQRGANATGLQQQQPNSHHMPNVLFNSGYVAGHGSGFGGANSGMQQNYDVVVNQSPSWQTTVYVGNLSPYTNQNDLIPMFQNFGFVVDVRIQSDRGYAFVRMDSHEAAALAICQLSGVQINGRPVRCSWGKDRSPVAAAAMGLGPSPSSVGPVGPRGGQASGGMNGYSGNYNQYYPQFGASGAAGAGASGFGLGGRNAGLESRGGYSSYAR
ncbi:hypothetical protein POJ06DRAFT_151763 [Lipomyces tetrasporus]|uniref:RRM domain-containing protein n=1 Tax=Lipomyces tetrasporus TaxID=54092 RepID=A0AAD7QNA1_9ASCO|nr:uncharacterized protein POJ06DRAFT_151763 [Lipomyces tetrasporus]KAJ8098450.1 hypothetical protein POJ06DRAFT_151763 [Lipomyces tetrasporus]